LTEITETNIGREFVVTFDARMLGAPAIRARVAAGRMTIASSEKMNESEAFALVEALNGARPGLDKGGPPLR
jgi:preprotein translocase subunit SecD